MYTSIAFSSPTATASDTTGTPGGLSDAIRLGLGIGIPSAVSLLGIIVTAVVTIWGVWYANKKKKEEGKCQLLTHSIVKTSSLGLST